MLARQLLLERASTPLARAVEQVGGLQTQYAPSGYVALWSRLRDFRRDALTRALERRRVIQGWVMRLTIHTVSARDYWPLVEGVREGRLRWWLSAFRRDAAGLDMERVAAVLREALRDGPRPQKELQEVLKAEGFPPAAWSGAGLWVDMIRVPPSGTWERRKADLYGLAEDWVGPSTATEEQGYDLLVRRYLGAFGPAPAKDIANWAGLQVGVLRPVVERLRLRRFRDEEGRELVDLPRGPLPDEHVPAPVRFLPSFEPALLTHARRTGIVPEEYRPRIQDIHQPHWPSAFIVDGRVAGTWRYEDGRVRTEAFAPIPRAARRELEDEASRLAAFHAG